MEEKNRFEKLRDMHLESLRLYGHSHWIAMGRMLKDGEETITVLRNPVTGEVVSNEGW